MNKRYTPTCFFAHIGAYQHRSPSVPETGKRQRGYVYPQRIGCGEHRFNRGFAPLEQSIGKPGTDTGPVSYTHLARRRLVFERRAHQGTVRTSVEGATRR